MPLEGIVSKGLDAPYFSGRGGSWVKTKCRAGQEVVIGGWTSEGKRLRSLLVGVHRGHGTDQQLVYVGRVGTGFSEAVMREWYRSCARSSDISPIRGRRQPARGSSISVGLGPSWWRRSSSPAGPAMAMCVRLPSRASRGQAGRGGRGRGSPCIRSMAKYGQTSPEGQTREA